jgi:hypothetical protein
VPGCIALAWWQATRALSGNTLSWAYTFEWPIFAGYALYMWWRLLHDATELGSEDDESGSRALPVTETARSIPDAGPDTKATTEDDPELAELSEYNDYLAALSASGRRKRW